VENGIIKGCFQDWKVAHVEEKSVKELCDYFKIPYWVSRFLINRGISSPPATEKFLYPSLDKLPTPEIFPGIGIAAERIREAITFNQPIAVYGDYDVDGITGTTILTDFLRFAGARVQPVLPNRFEHGYGLNARIIDELASLGVKLLITVDCGITNVREVDYASKLGIDTIVTDHHRPGPDLPKALAVINPHLIFENQHNLEADNPGYLAGVSVAFYLMIYLRKHFRETNFWKHKVEPNLKKYLDLVALGTIADQVPITGINRILTKFGLPVLERSEKPGVKALLQLCKLTNKKISVWDVGFLLAPRINAAGRMGVEHLALELLMHDDTSKAQRIALELDRLNQKRQHCEEKILKEALDMIENPVHCLKEASALVLANDDWHRGIIGIVASRIVDRFGKPAILLAKNEGYWEGSARSVSSFDIFKALTQCKDTLEKFGGHRMAAGLRVSPDNLNAFVESFNRIASETIPSTGIRKQITIDSKLALRDITPQTMEFIDKLSPYGLGNPRPVFLLESFRVRDLRVLKDKHLMLYIEQNGKSMRALGFNLVEDPAKLPNSFRYLAFYPVYNHWEGNTYLELRILDFC